MSFSGSEAVHLRRELLKYSRKITFIYIDHFIYIDKRKFHVDLCKFRLSVRTEIFVTKTSCNLNILGQIPNTSKVVYKAAATAEVRKNFPDARGLALNNLSRLPVLFPKLPASLPQEILPLRKTVLSMSSLDFHHQISLKIGSSKVKIAIFQTNFFFVLEFSSIGNGGVKASERILSSLGITSISLSQSYRLQRRNALPPLRRSQRHIRNEVLCLLDQRCASVLPSSHTT